MPKSEKNSTTKGKTTKDLLTKHYTLTLQGNALNRFSRTTSKRNMKKIAMSKKKVTQFASVTVEFEKGMDTATAQVMDYVNSLFTTGTNQKSSKIEFTVDQYMKDAGPRLTSYRYARAKLKKALSNILSLTFSYSGGSKYSKHDYSFAEMHVYSEYKIKRGGDVSITLAPTYHKLLRDSFPMPMPKLLFQLNPQTQATAWYILRTLTENKRMNYGKTNADRMKIKYILERCPSLPAYKDVMGKSKDGHIRQKIIEPFFASLEALTKAIDYSFIAPDGQPFDYEKELSYETFANSTMVVKKWLDYPDNYMISYNKKRKSKQLHKSKNQ